jgi:hypothetical protein
MIYGETFCSNGMKKKGGMAVASEGLFRIEGCLLSADLISVKQNPMPGALFAPGCDLCLMHV